MEVNFSLRVLINKETNKVLFAEVDTHFADILISFLTLPLGTIMKLLEEYYGDETPTIGSLNTLFHDLEDLDLSNIWTTEGQLMRLNLENTLEAHLKNLNINIDDDTEPTKYFSCENCSCNMDKEAVVQSMYYGTIKCECGRLMNTDIRYSDKVGLGTETTLFLLTDGLQLMPNTVGFGLQILDELGIDEVCMVEEKTAFFGYGAVMDLLKGSLVSKTPLTDLFFPKTQKASLALNSKFGTFIGKNTSTAAAKKMRVKAIVQISTSKILLAQTGEDFFDFLFSFLTIPFGGVFSILGGVSFRSIQNLYESLAGLNIENSLNSPYLSLKYLSKYKIFPIVEHNPNEIARYVLLKDPEGQGSYISGPAMFTVTDDLVVKPMSAIYGFSIIKGLKIPVNDIEEHGIDIGAEEALSIMMASLFSTSALNNGLKHLLRRQLEQDN